MSFVRVCPILNFVDVIVLVEINIKIEENNLYNLDGFCAEFENREKRKGGGVAMFIKNHLNYERLNIVTTSYENLTVKVFSNSKNKIVSGVYRPPKHNENEFIDGFEKITNMRQQSDIIILGDININVKESTKSYGLNYQEMLAFNGLCNVITRAARIDLNPRTWTLIDHILVNLKEHKSFSDIVENNISDHYSTMCGVYNACSNENDLRLRSVISTSQVNRLIRATD